MGSVVVQAPAREGAQAEESPMRPAPPRPRSEPSKGQTGPESGPCSPDERFSLNNLIKLSGGGLLVIDFDLRIAILVGDILNLKRICGAIGSKERDKGLTVRVHRL